MRPGLARAGLQKRSTERFLRFQRSARVASTVLFGF
jgi:hypothetical protein